MIYIGAIIAFVPTLSLMYFILRKYTYPAVERPFFSDPTFFILFSIGLVTGTILLAAYSYLMGTLMYVIFFSIIECLILVVMMNLKRYRGKSDSVFYGLGLGLGAGCSMDYGMVYLVGQSSEYLGNSIDFAGYIILAVLGVTLLMQYTAIGTIIGEGIARHRPMEFMVKAMIINVVFYVTLFVMLLNSDNTMFYLALAAAVLESSMSLYYTDFVQLPRVVNDVLRMEGIKRDDIPK